MLKRGTYIIYYVCINERKKKNKFVGPTRERKFINFNALFLNIEPFVDQNPSASVSAAAAALEYTHPVSPAAVEILIPATMYMLITCSSCRTPLQVPPGAPSIRCAICQAITNVADPRHAPPPAQPAPYSHAPPSPSPSPSPPQPSPYSHAPPGAPPNAHGRKKAVIVGISYKFSRHELKGCINDAKCMKYLLINKFRFPEASIIMLTGKGGN